MSEGSTFSTSSPILVYCLSLNFSHSWWCEMVSQYSLNLHFQHEFGWTPGVGDGQGGLVLWFMGSQRVGHNWANELNWMKIMVTSFKRSHVCTATLSAPNPAAGHHRPTPPLETPGHFWASLGQSLVGSLLLSPGSWCTQSSVCALQESTLLPIPV